MPLSMCLNVPERRVLRYVSYDLVIGLEADGLWGSFLHNQIQE